MNSLTKPIPRILLIDDDETYGLLLKRVAANEGIPVSYYSSARAAYRDMDKLHFDVAIIDFDLGPVTGAQLSNFMESRHVTAPIILMSGTERISTSVPWSTHVKKIENKTRGAVGILHDALKVCGAA